MISTSDVGLAALAMAAVTLSTALEQPNWEMGLTGSSLCWSLTVATAEEAQTCKADLPSDADCSMLQVVSECSLQLQMLQRNKKGVALESRGEREGTI